jgi:SAM-dependent methyltransferase
MAPSDKHVVRTFFEQIADRYDEENYVLGPHRPVPGPRLLVCLRAAIEALPLGNWADLGCGTGRPLGVLAARGHRVIGVDYSSRMLAMARVNMPRDGVRFEETEATEWLRSCETASLDGILALELLPFLDDEAEAVLLQEAHRVLRPGGTLVVSNHNALAEFFRFDRVTIDRWERDVLPALAEGDADLATQLSLAFRGLLTVGEYPVAGSRGQQRVLRISSANLEVRLHDPLAFILGALPGVGFTVVGPPMWYGLRPVPPLLRGALAGVHDLLVQRAEAAIATRFPAYLLAERFLVVAGPVGSGAR